MSSKGLAASLLMATDVHSQELMLTIGSQIRTLSLWWIHGGFLYHLRDNVDRVRLETLELKQSSDTHGIEFYECIPKLVSLRTLKLRPFVGRWDFELMVDGLRANSSIVEVETSTNNRNVGFTATQLRLIDAFCQRNRHLDTIIESDPCPYNADEGRSVNTNLLLRPSFLQCTEQMPHAHIIKLTRGLTALGQNIGYDNSD
jgi:hypothetical protein